MKKFLSFILFAFILQSAFAQTEKLYVVVFKDKKNSAYSVSKPGEFLSDKAIQRRQKQHIPIREMDLPVNEYYVDQIKALGVGVKNRSKWLNAVTISCNDESELDVLKNLSFVRSVTLADNSLRSASVSSKFEVETAQVNPDLRSPASVLNYGPSFFQANQIGADCMHDLGYLGQGMTIAVIDAGFFKADSLPAFDSLWANGQIKGCRDFVIGDTLVFEDFPHGMNVLSCMGANLPGQLIGTAPKADYWLLRTEDAFSETLVEEMYWLVGAEFADSVGADVINSSLGYSKFDGGIGDHFYSDMDGNTTIVTKAADWAASVGIFVTNSAGNSGGPPWYKITAPADADSILTVGAVDSAGLITGFSSRGLTFDGRIKPNTCARGYQAVIAANFGGIGGANGTSFSSPITAGAVACLWQSNPTATNMQLIYAIEQSATQATMPDSIMGYGIPNFCKADSILNIMLGINDGISTNENILNVYPNPFSADFTMEYYSARKETVRIELYDVTGRKLYEENQTFAANTSNKVLLGCIPGLAKGAYTLCVVGSEKIYYSKLIKQ